MNPGRYSEIFGRGERLGCTLNLGHSFDAIEAYLLLVSLQTLARVAQVARHRANDSVVLYLF